MVQSRKATGSVRFVSRPAARLRLTTEGVAHPDLLLSNITSSAMSARGGGGDKSMIALCFLLPC